MGGYALIGGRLAHSFSPRIHALLGDYPYQLLPMDEAALDSFLRDTDLDGFNVTIPYKETVIPYLRALSETAARVGSVNTVVRGADGALHGHNTDYDGFLRMLGDPARLRGQKALVLGSGGSAKTVCAVLADQGCAPVVTISRGGPDNYQNIRRHADAFLVVNTTPVGMYPDADASPVDLALFPRCALALDLIYNPAKTRFLLQAQALGIECRNGLTMLVAQAVRASELFGRRAPGADVTGEIVATLAREVRAIALIGMPGCGKTRVGRALADLTGRPFYDTDELAERELGMSVPDCFARLGEAAFREAEARALAWAAMQRGAIVATGGGAVTVPKNRTPLLQNCLTIFLRRELAALPAADRPLTQARGIEALYRERLPLYETWSERAYDNFDILETARAIAKDCC